MSFRIFICDHQARGASSSAAAGRGGRFVERSVGEEPCLIAHDAAIRTGALSEILIVWNAAEKQEEVSCKRGSAPRADRLLRLVRWSGCAGRAFEPGCTAGEPIDAKLTFDPVPESGARAYNVAGATA